MYALSAKTHLDGQPSLTSAWIMMTGFECVNLLTVFFSYLLLSGASIPISRGTFLAALVLVLVLNGIYIATRSGEILSARPIARRKQHTFALVYGVVSSLALLGVMAGMFVQVAK